MQRKRARKRLKNKGNNKNRVLSSAMSASHFCPYLMGINQINVYIIMLDEDTVFK